jgi:hypothetical protein
MAMRMWGIPVIFWLAACPCNCKRFEDMSFNALY